MSKFFKTLLEQDWVVADPDLKHSIQDLYDSCKPATRARITPAKPTEDEKASASEGDLITCEEEDVQFVLNPVSKKWTRCDSAIGKVIMYHHDNHS